MEEDDILYQSIIADPEQVSPDVDVSGLRTETETSPELLASVSEFPGLQFDPTQYSSYEDLYDLYSRGLPMVETPETDTAQIPGAADILVDAGSQDQATGDLTTDLTTDPINTGAQQNLIDQGIGVQGAIGDPVVAPGEAPVTQQEIDEFNFPALTQDSTAEDISQDLANQQVMLDPTDGNIMDEVALTGGDTGILDSVSGALSGVSTAARNAFETVKDGTSTAVQFISDYGYPAYQALQGNLVAAGTALVNPLTLGLGFAGKIFESVGDTKSKQEYDSYSPEQQSEIDKAYGPGGVMEGYNAVSQFGEGPKATIQSRLDTRRANGISDSSPTSQQLIGLQDNLDITDFTQLTQDDISDRDDVDPADVGLIAAGSADVQDYADIMPDELPDVTDPVDDFKVSGNVGTSASEVFDTAFGPVPSPDPAIADAALSGSFYVDDGGSDDSASTGVDAGTADVQDYADTYDPSESSSSGGSSGGGGSTKIVCTMMNETYGFGSFRNKIWQKYAKDNLTREHEKGYHKIFLPLVRLSKTNIIVRKILEHIAVHRTIDIRQEARGKTHILGRVYRKVLEPICYLVGKYAKR
jgi:hypothetical protein